MNHDDAVNAALLALAEAMTANWPAQDQPAAARFILQQLRAGDRESLVDVAGKQVTLSGAALIQLVVDAMRAPELNDNMNRATAESDGFLIGWKKYHKPIRDRQRKKAMLGRKRTTSGDAVTPAMVQAFAAEWHTKNPGRQKGLMKAIWGEYGLTSKTAHIYLNKTE